MTCGLFVAFVFVVSVPSVLLKLITNMDCNTDESMNKDRLSKNPNNFVLPPRKRTKPSLIDEHQLDKDGFMSMTNYLTCTCKLTEIWVRPQTTTLVYGVKSSYTRVYNTKSGGSSVFITMFCEVNAIFTSVKGRDSPEGQRNMWRQVHET